MNIVTYNIIKYQSDNKLNNKVLAQRLSVEVKQLKQMKKETYVYSDEEITKLSENIIKKAEQVVWPAPLNFTYKSFQYNYL